MKRLLLVIIFLGFRFAIFAQQSPVSGGADVKSNAGSVSFSVGQVFDASQTGNGGSLNQGNQQPQFLISTSISNMPNQVAYKIFPNPAVDYINIEVTGLTNFDFTYQLLDVNGQVIASGVFASSTFKYSLAGLSSSTYYLRITNNTQNFQVFKISKV